MGISPVPPIILFVIEMLEWVPTKGAGFISAYNHGYAGYRSRRTHDEAFMNNFYPPLREYISE